MKAKTGRKAGKARRLRKQKKSPGLALERFAEEAEDEGEENEVDEEGKGNDLAEWKSDDGDGSSDDAMESRKDRLSARSVTETLPIKKILCKKGARAYALIADMGEGVEGFLPLGSLVSDKELRAVLSARLGTMQDVAPPLRGRPDRRPKVRKVIVSGQGRAANQLLLSGEGAAVCSALHEGWDELPEPCKALLSLLFDRDRVGDYTSFSGMEVGLLLEGVVQQSTPEGLVVSLSNPRNPSQRNLTGVAVGINAQAPSSSSFPAFPSSPSTAPGTPCSVVSRDNYSASFRPGTLKCRVLDYDPAAGFVDVSVASPVALTRAAVDRKAFASSMKTLKKKLGKSIPVQVVLLKKTYAIVVSRPYSGILGYLALAEGEKVKAGERYTATVRYVWTKQANQQALLQHQQQKKKRAAALSAAKKELSSGRTGLDEAEKEELLRKKKEQCKQEASDPKSALDPWLSAEPFAVLTLDHEQEGVKRKRSEEEPVKKEEEVRKEQAAQQQQQQPPPSPTSSPASKKLKTEPAKPPAPLEVGFDFRDDGEEDDSEEDTTGDGQKEKKKKKKKKKEKDPELLVDELERNRLNASEPKTKEDFERLVMASPHSSYVWAQYMAFHVAQREFEQARLTAERALTTINYRESEELFNIWVAYLNLENLHGTPESMNEVFMRFVRHSDQPEKAYGALISIGRATNHHVLVDKTFQTILKKFGAGSTKPWVDYADYLISRGRHDDLNKLQKRLLNNDSLSQKQHVDIIQKIGCLQYRQGSIDRGRTIFEGLLIKYPKRADVWSVYLDMEQVVLPQLGDLTRIRNVFDRVTSLNLSSKKMQYFLSRYAAFEKEKGTPERVEYVRKRAVEFVESKLGSA